MPERDFERFFSDNQNLLFRIVRRYVRKRDLAEDIVLETMFLIHQKWERVMGFENQTGYAVRIAVNKAKRHLIGTRVSRLISFFKEGEEPEIPSMHSNPEHKVMHKDEDDWLTVQLDKLKSHEKEIVLLKDLDHKKFEEIAVILKTKLPTVKSLYRRAKIKLSRVWEERYGG